MNLLSTLLPLTLFHSSSHWPHVMGVTAQTEAKGQRSGGRSLACLADPAQLSGDPPWFRDTRMQNTLKRIDACMPESPTRAKDNPEIENILFLRPLCHPSPKLGLRGHVLLLEDQWLVPGLKEQAGLRTVLKGKQRAGIQNARAWWEVGSGGGGFSWGGSS